MTNELMQDKRLYVQELQGHLQTIQREKQGYTDVPRDGFFGETTVAAVKEEQRLAGLPETGVVDFATWEHIRKTCGELARANSPAIPICGFPLHGRPFSEGSQGNGVAFLHLMLWELRQKYVNLSPVERFSAEYSSATARCVSQLQEVYRLPVTGITDKVTWDTVVGLYNDTLSTGEGQPR